jgi:hypothetical protein
MLCSQTHVEKIATHKEHESVYAILRYDGFQGELSAPEGSITVKEVVRSRDVAEAEVTRLNAINGEKDVRYWWQYTRLFPQGQSAVSQVEPRAGN